MDARGARPRQHAADAELRALGERSAGLADTTARPGSQILGVELAEDAVRLADLPMARRRTVVVLGHERTGIPYEALDLLDDVVEIPMIGTGAGLDVAVAGSLVLYKLAGMS